MANMENGTPESSVADQNWKEAATDHRKAYSGFVGFAVVGTVLVSLVLIAMAIFLV